MKELYEAIEHLKRVMKTQYNSEVLSIQVMQDTYWNIFSDLEREAAKFRTTRHFQDEQEPRNLTILGVKFDAVSS
jgi:hypothetical protein